MSLSAVNLAARVDEQRAVTTAAQHRHWQVLLLPPNLVCLGRLLLVVAACAAGPGPLAFHCLAVSLALDALDGWLARRLRQETGFGAFLDVAVDNATRAVLWSCGSGGAAWAALPVALEAAVFACTHAMGGAAWKTGCFRGAPRWVQAVVHNGFRSLPGSLAVAGLSGCPLWLCARRFLPPGSLAAAGAWGLLLVPGRLLSGSVELWVLHRRVQALLQEDAERLLRNGASPRG